MEDKNEPITEMSISRHFKNHYPKRKAYFYNVKTMEDESIQKAIKSCSHLKDFFHETRNEPDWDKPVYDDNGNIIKFEWKEVSLIPYNGKTRK
jgi:hypothetical protein